MNVLTSIKVKNKEDSLKYAYAFMQSETLNIKECAFMNPKPTKLEKDYITPRDMYSETYNNNVPPWEVFKKHPAHLASSSFVCVASLDKQDQQRVNLTLLGDRVLFVCYGNYVKDAENALNTIILAHSTI